jgi:hypothetical protein
LSGNFPIQYDLKEGDASSLLLFNFALEYDASMEVGLEIIAEKTKYMLLSLHQNAGQNHDINIANRLFENIALLKYLETTVTNKNTFQ